MTALERSLREYRTWKNMHGLGRCRAAWRAKHGLVRGLWALLVVLSG